MSSSNFTIVSDTHECDLIQPRSIDNLTFVCYTHKYPFRLALTNQHLSSSRDQYLRQELLIPFVSTRELASARFQFLGCAGTVGIQISYWISH
jgi:hypothetical protein